MNNPFSSALSELGNNIGKIKSGENSLFAPQVTELFGFNVQGVPLISSRDYFLTQMESWFTSIPLQTQWIVLINPYPKCVNTSILQGLERTEGNSKAFDLNKAKSILTSYPLQKVTGCIFAQGVNLPAESFDVEYVNVENNRGFTPAPITSKRANPGQLTMDFLETNTSFTDFVIRPWIIAGSHFGFVARDPKDKVEASKNVRTTVTILQYTRTYQRVSMIPRKIWTFYNCAPINIGDQSLTYDSEAFTGGRAFHQTRWVYSHYTVENNLYLPLANIINRISNGQLPSITTLQQAGGIAGINPAGLF